LTKEAEFEKRQLDEIKKILKEEPNLQNMEKKIKETHELVEKENKVYNHWRESAELYSKREALGRQRYYVNWVERQKIERKISQLDKEIKLKTGGLSGEDFFELYDSVQEMHYAVLQHAKDLQRKLKYGIHIYNKNNLKENKIHVSEEPTKQESKQEKKQEVKQETKQTNNQKRQKR
jgi:hypothetical protein